MTVMVYFGENDIPTGETKQEKVKESFKISENVNRRADVVRLLDDSGEQIHVYF